MKSLNELVVLQLTLSIGAFFAWFVITWWARNLLVLIKNREDRVFATVLLLVFDVVVVYLLVRSWDDAFGLDHNLVLFVGSLTQAFLFMLGVSLIASWAMRKGRTAERGY